TLIPANGSRDDDTRHARFRHLAAENLARPARVLSRRRERPPANPLGFRGKTAPAGEIGTRRLTWAGEGSKMVVGASARRPETPEPRAAQSRLFNDRQGRVAGATAPARPEVNRGRRVET